MARLSLISVFESAAICRKPKLSELAMMPFESGAFFVQVAA
jgi:hypothetical protein